MRYALTLEGMVAAQKQEIRRLHKHDGSTRFPYRVTIRMSGSLYRELERRRRKEAPTWTKSEYMRVALEWLMLWEPIQRKLLHDAQENNENQVFTGVNI